MIDMALSGELSCTRTGLVITYEFCVYTSRVFFYYFFAAQWVNPLPADLAVSGSNPSGGGILSNGAALYTDT